MNEPQDIRGALYEDLHRGQLSQEEQANQFSADFILTELFRYLTPKSVLDVGCGIGTWLAVAQAKGVTDVLGIEGKWLDRRLARIPGDRVLDLDLEQPFDLGRRFDLVICLEVAEHLSAQAAVGFVESLVRHADVILFSAAIPFQGGHHHVNEQFLDYWARLFADLAYQAVDCLRSMLWNKDEILWWLRQNIVIFAKSELTVGQGPFAAVAQAGGPLSIVHPDIYLDRMKMSQKVNEDHAKLIALLSSGTTFSVNRLPNGQLTVNKIS